MKVGIIRTSSIGDAVLATVCLDYLRRVAPDAEVFWVGRQPSLKLIQESWPKITVAEWSRKSPGSGSATIYENLMACDIVVDLQTSFRTRMLMRKLMLGGKLVFSARKSGWFRFRLVFEGFLRGRFKKLPEISRSARIYQYRMMLFAVHEGMALLKKSNDDALDLARPALVAAPITAADSTWVNDLSFGTWLALAPGASHEPKRAPTDVFLDILTALAHSWPVGTPLPGLLFVGGADDRKAAVNLLDQMVWEGSVLNVAGKLTLEQTATAIAACQGLLSNDSGLAHIAEAIGKPVAVLFGPTSEAFGFPPQRAESRAFSAALGCRPCSKHGKNYCRYGDQLCFRSIDTLEVARFLAGILCQKESV
ncbi:MAG: glycosyltransferase family 9 protein [Pseudomonadota bacterium]